jgi:hypothetical protein
MAHPGTTTGKSIQDKRYDLPLPCGDHDLAQ